MLGEGILLYLVLLPIIGAFACYLIGREWKEVRDYLAVVITLLEILLFAVLMRRFFITGEVYSFYLKGFGGFGISFVLDGFRLLYGMIASVMWFVTMLFSKEYFVHYRNRNRYYFFNLITFGATIGVFLSADLYTTFLFFEMMSLASYIWVAQDEKKDSLRAGDTYLAIAIIGGLVMLMGLFLTYHTLGTLDFSKIYVAAQASNQKGMLIAAGFCLFIGFAAKAGAFPLHIWLPKAHPVAPAPASALLSGILTKTGIFGVLLVTTNFFFKEFYWGKFLLIISCITMLLGAVLALFSTDLKRTLACSSVSQIGFILTGIAMMNLLGEHNAIAAWGTVLHMVNHSLFKLILFLAAGVVFCNIHSLDLNQIQGFGRKKPLLHMVFLFGGLGISGIPLFSGYISKTLLHESIIEYGAFPFVEWIFLLTGGVTVAYMTKLYICIFIEKNTDPMLQSKYDAKKPYMSRIFGISIFAIAIGILFMGSFPHQWMEKMAVLSEAFLKAESPTHAIHYFSFANLSGAIISLIIGAVLYLVVVRRFLWKEKYQNRWPSWLDLEDKVYRPILIGALPLIFGIISRVADSIVDFTIVLLRKTIYKDRKIPCELMEGNILTYVTGSALDYLLLLKNKIFRKENIHQISYVHKLAVLREIQRENNTIIGRSLSFGLFMFCIGLCLTLIYLLFL